MSKKTHRNSAAIICDIREAAGLARRSVIRDLCPCRNRERDHDVWREVFRQAREGSRGERNAAAHTIGTLMQKAATTKSWRDVLRALQNDLDATMAEPRAASLILGQMKRHGHAHRGAARQSYRRHRKVLELGSKEALAEWVTDRLELPSKLSARDPGLDRLWRWHQHRVRFQPNRRTKEAELLEKAQQFVSAGA
ncbi:hypothetical protein [Candidatus Entotheonella palauensis]|uniref:Uncharacterized protein n=1 Tax=Candidatus Entotheonella gemina TaxID=1429439 RepID=W4M5U5_9BACT|nr:hypothetical protein [Candidatus Entotheonella palauensis]ETX05553.1 MAG: hypothetical protein ETSY2_22300 [Candidatus Entotheonella gemina]